MESIGNRLRAAREDKGLSIEDAAHQTRIQAIYIGGLENDDYSNFPSTTYAKSFLTLYSRFLGVDAAEALEHFSGGDAIFLSGQGYLESVTDNIEPRRPSSVYAGRSSRPSGSRKRPVRENSPGLAPLFLGLVLVALVIAIPTLWILGKDADTFDEAVTKGKELTNTSFSPSEKEGEKAEAKSVDTSKVPESQAPAVPPPSPPQSAPANTANPPKGETRVAQVTPSNGNRTLNTSPGSANPVSTGEKPKIEGGAAALKAKPGTEEGSGPEVAPSPPQTQPLRAVPLIARPVIIPEEGESETSDDPETPVEDDGEETDVRTDGNQFPRPL